MTQRQLATINNIAEAHFSDVEEYLPIYELKMTKFPRLVITLLIPPSIIILLIMQQKP